MAPSSGRSAPARWTGSRSRRRRSTFSRSNSSRRARATSGAPTTCTLSCAARNRIANSRATTSIRSWRWSAKASRRRAAAAGVLPPPRSRQRPRPRAAWRQAGRDHVRRCDSRPGRLCGHRRARGRADRHDRRRLCLRREHGQARHLPAGPDLVEDPRRVEAGKVRVEDARGAAPSVPFWNGEGLGRTLELSRTRSPAVCASRTRPAPTAFEAEYARLGRDCGLDRAWRGTSRRLRAGGQGRARVSTIPDVHDRRRGAILRRGRRDAARPSRAVWRPHQPRLGALAAQAVLPHVQLRAAGRGHRQRHRHLAFRPARVSRSTPSSSFLHTASVENVLTQALLAAPMFQVRWRWNATRSLAILRGSAGGAGKCRRRSSE